MSPHDYVKVLREQSAIIDQANVAIAKARAKADKAKPPKRRRAAAARDIVEGAIIWHENGDDGWFWNIVGRVLCPDDDFKAYCADDGCRYGLDGAWVEVLP